jgi:hypothetical protein
MTTKYQRSLHQSLFPEAPHEDAGSMGIATAQQPVPHDTSSPRPDESSNKSAPNECDTTSVNEIAKSGLKDDSEYPVGSQEAVPQNGRSDLIPDGAGDLNVHCDPSDTTTTPFKNAHDRDGAEFLVSEASDRIAASATGPSPAPHLHDEVLVNGDKVSPGTPRNDSASLGVCPNPSHEPNSIATSEDAKEANPPSNDAANEADKPTELALPDDDDGQAVLKGSTGAGLDEAGADVPKQEESQTTGAFSEVGDSEQGGESKQTEEGVSAPAQRTEVSSLPTGKQSAKRKSHPTVIVNERDYLNQSEQETLDRLKELNQKQQRNPLPGLLPDEVRASHSELLTESATCTKTVYRNIRKLIEKGFISLIESGKAGSGAKYRIVPEVEVKKQRLEKRLTHWVQVGSGLKAVPDPEEGDEHDD